MRAGSVLAALAALGLCAPAAFAAQEAAFIPSNALTASPPELAGDQVVYVQDTRSDLDHYGFKIIAAKPGAKLRTLLEVKPSAGDKTYGEIDIDASAKRLAYRQRAFGVEIGGEIKEDAFFTGPFAGPYSTRFDPCGENEISRVLLVDGDTVARSGPCEQDTPTGLTIHDFSGGLPDRTVRDGDIDLDSVRLAGQFLGYTSSSSQPVRGADFAVYDLVTNAEIYRARPPQAGRGALRAIDVQPDGKAAVVFDPDSEVSRPGCDYDIAWLSPAEPTLHVLPQRSCGPGIQIHGDKIVFVRITQPAGGIPVKEFVRTDLAGSEPTVLGRTVGPAGSFDDPDYGASLEFDGQRISWADGNCHASRYMIENVASPSPATLPKSVKCPVKILKPEGKKPVKLVKVQVPVQVRCRAGCANLFSGLEYSVGKLKFSDELYAPPGKVKTQLLDLSEEMVAAFKTGKKVRDFRVRAVQRHLDGTEKRTGSVKIRVKVR